jgi:hypothetical protein
MGEGWEGGGRVFEGFQATLEEWRELTSISWKSFLCTLKEYAYDPSSFI